MPLQPAGIRGSTLHFPLLALGLLLASLASAGCPGSGPSTGEGTSAVDAEIKSAGIAPAPPLSIVPERPMSGQAVKVHVAAEGAASIQLTLSGSGCGTLAPRSGTSSLDVAGAAASDGFCDLTARVVSASGTQTLMGHFEVQATRPQLPPVVPADGVYLLRAPPAPSGGPQISATSGPPSFINGGKATYTFTFTGRSEARAALLVVPGYPGYYLTPVSPSGTQVSLELSFADDYFQTSTAPHRRAMHAATAAAAGSLGLLVSLVDAAGAVGNAIALALAPKQAMTGDVKVSIAWDTPTDVDLHVTEPSGEHLYYGHKSSATGGRLDVDSNAGCRIDSINNENIYWPADQSPTGTYQVSVQMYDAPCDLADGTSGPGGAAGTLTMTFCGPGSPSSVPFTLGGTGSRFVTTFQSVCTKRIAGTIRYEDFPVLDTGLGAGAMVPARFIAVQVVRSKDDAVLAEGATDAAGKYDLSFSNDGAAGFYLQALAKRDSPGLKQQVQDQGGALYTFRTPKKTDPPLDDGAMPAGGFAIDLEVKKADGAGALNIFDVGLNSALYTFVHSHTRPPPLTFFWTAGQAAPDGVVSYFSKPGSIWVNSDPTDPDEYDDVVLGHEYGHFVMAGYSQDDSRGGAHSPYNRVAPALAWSEGWATFFGCSSQARSSYADTTARGMGVFFSIETMPARVPMGSATGTLGANLSEAVVSGVLYDLFDDTNEDKDTLSGKNTAIWSVLTTYLKGGNAKFADRGVAGRDLVDFLDGWRCLGFGDEGADSAHGLRGIVQGIYGLSYDFAAVASCK